MKEDDDGKDYTTEDQLATLRYIIITAKRAKLIDKAYDFSDPNGGWFNTRSGNIVIKGIPALIAKVLKPKDIPPRFDGLLALTIALDCSIQSLLLQLDRPLLGIFHLECSDALILL